MMLKSFKLSFYCLFVLLYTFISSAQDSPIKLIQSQESKLRKILDTKAAPGSQAEKQRQEKIDKIVSDYIDFSEIAKNSLGKNWEPRIDSEKAEFTDLLHKVIQKSYINRLENTKADYTIQYKNEKITQNKASVTSIAKIKQDKNWNEMEIIYYMKISGNNWKIVDIETDGVSLVTNYKSQFASIIKKEGYSGLVDRLKRKLQ